MKILVLGSGVIGVTTAYILATRGYTVEVIDRAPTSAAEGSNANGGQLSYSHAEPWANPAIFGKICRWLFRQNAPLILHPRADIHMIKWGLKFLANCTQNSANINTVTMLRLGLYSKKKLEQLISATAIDFEHSHEGILHLFFNYKTFEQAKKQLQFQETLGCKQQLLTADECLQKEPTLEYSRCDIIGGIYAHMDESGDARIFTQKLAKICKNDFAVKFHYGTNILRLNKQSDKITSITTNCGELHADNYIVAMGAHSYNPLHEVGIKIPIYPIKGYSVTTAANMYAPRTSITDQENKLVYSRLGDNLRIAGKVEFAGYNDNINKKHIQHIIKSSSALFPKLFTDDLVDNSNNMECWACLRPCTPDGPPVIGTTPIKNLYINTGHGALGWTQAAGSAFLLADIIEGKPTEISLDGITMDRYL